jgi:drug/metabolite transporter (DMT)-like permease
MNALFPIVAALLWAGSFALDKEILNMKRVNWRRYLLASFILLFVVHAAWFALIRPPWHWALLTGTFFLLLLVNTVRHVGANILYYRALQHDDLNELNLWSMFHSIPTIIVTGILFADERNWIVVIPALVASIAVVWSHTNHHKLVIRRRTAPYIIWSFISAPMGAIIAKILLREWHPVSLGLALHVALAVVFVALYHRSWKPVGTSSSLMLLLTNIMVGSASVLVMFGYQRLGVVYTVLLFSLHPILVNVFSSVFLGERITRKRSIGFAVVLASIVVAQLLK